MSDDASSATTSWAEEATSETQEGASRPHEFVGPIKDTHTDLWTVLCRTHEWTRSHQDLRVVAKLMAAHEQVTGLDLPSIGDAHHAAAQAADRASDLWVAFWNSWKRGSRAHRLRCLLSWTEREVARAAFELWYRQYRQAGAP